MSTKKNRIPNNINVNNNIYLKEICLIQLYNFIFCIFVAPTLYCQKNFIKSLNNSLKFVGI